MTKRLIINADDFGLTEDVNRGIIECYSRGAVTDISLFAVGESYEDAVRLAKKNGIDKLGVHLALTRSFKPASPFGKIPSLVEKNGQFPGDYIEFLVKFFAGRVNGGEIYTELKNQILKIKKEGFKISHVDGHQHVHMVPGILKIAVRLMREEGIEYIRFPMEKVNLLTKLGEPRNIVRNLSLSFMCGISGRLLESLGAKHNDFFIGHFHAQSLTRADLFSAIEHLKNGLTELGCHPGYFTPEMKKRHPRYKSCEEELNVLCDKSFIEAIKNNSIELVSY